MTALKGGDAVQPRPVERITVSLIAKAADDLRQTHERTGLSKTDIVNRAIGLYAFIDEQQTAGGVLVLRHGDEEQRIQLL